MAKNDPRGAQDGSSHRSGNGEIHGVTLPELIASAKSGVMPLRGADQQITERRGISFGEAEGTTENEGFVASDRMGRIEQIIRQLTEIGEGALRVWEEHTGIMGWTAAGWRAKAPVLAFPKG